jgi:hypothetical protein
MQAPFGYFRAEPFGWTDCAETDEGAIALYERPPAREWVGLTEQQKQKLAENWFAEDWAITKAIGMMYDHEVKLKEKNT